ncbi:MAG: heterodisulfide reductase-related iron-sulfur binding cluster [Nitrospinota bacterium]
MEATREVFGNVPGGEWIYLIAAASVAVFLWGILRRVRLWRIGKEAKRLDRWGERIGGLFVYAFAHKGFFRERLPGVGHLLLFFGFLAALIATTIIAIEKDLGYLGILVHFWKGSFYLWYSLIGDLLMALGVAGLILLGFRRYLLRPPHLKETWDDAVAWGGLVLVFLTGFLVEGLRIAATELRQHPDWAPWSPAGYVLAQWLTAGGPTERGLLTLHRAGWWVHVALSFGLIAYMGWSKLSHALFSPLAILFRNLDARTEPALSYINFEDETVESFGVSKLKELTWKDLLDADACTLCGKCDAACPAHLSGTPLSPKSIIQDLKRHMTVYGDSDDGPSLIETLNPEAIWACRTCGACQEACPVHIEHIPKIIEARRQQVLMESKMPETAQTFLKSLDDRMHPWKGTRFSRTAWMEGLDVPLLTDKGSAEILYWVGCTASLVDRNMKTAQALVKVLKAAGVDFAVLGAEEVCTGDPARRVGNEYSFQILAQKNIETLDRYGVKKVLTHCPHCFNAFKREYPQLGGHYEVIHHAEFVADLIRTGELKVSGESIGRIAYHDSCYLGRHNGIYDAPREVVSALPGADVREMKRNRANGLCCGAGGGFAWMEDGQVRDRVNRIRVQDALDAAVNTVAVACPFCVQMFEDGIKTKNADDRLVVRDIAELVAEALD